MVTKSEENGAEVSTVTQSVPDYIPGVDWSELVQTADAFAGSDLAKDELLDAMAGIPFLVTRLVFRKGIKRSNGVQAAYVSAECVVADADTLKRRRVDMSTLPFEPLQQIVFNDGSTGIYRQMVAYLAIKGIISLDESKPENGGYGESRYDSAPVEWTAINDGETTFDDDGWVNYSVNVRILAPRGIRLSEYQSDFNPNGNSKTRYIA